MPTKSEQSKEQRFNKSPSMDLKNDDSSGNGGVDKTKNPKTEESGNGSDKEPGQHKTPLIIHQFVWLLTVGLLVYFWSNLQETKVPEIDYSAFKEEIRSNNVEKVSFKDNVITGQFKLPVNLLSDPGNNKRDTPQSFETILPAFGDTELLPLLESQGVAIKVLTSKTPTWVILLSSMAPWILLVGLFFYSSRILQGTLSGGRGGGAFSFSKSRAKQYEAQAINTRYSDVAGLDAAKQDLMEIVNFLKDPQKYHALGAKMPKGLLMMGPPGCGKTLLAKATAGEAGVPFFSVSGSEFIEMFVGVGASRVRDMFENARKNAPALIFIDEIDSVGRARGTGLGGGNDEREQTLNQILAEMDGFTAEESVVVLAATNRPDVLDTALMRPGRFDRKVILELPGKKARLEILKVHVKHVPISDDVDLEYIASAVVGFSGADLANLVNEAALSAVRADRNDVRKSDFDIARDKIILGAESQEILSEEEKIRVAYHEVGHALTSLLVKSSDPLNKITIVPHGRAMGMTEIIPNEDKHNFTQNYLEDRLCILLGGRCAEKLQFSEVSSGAQDDLKRATELARQMISQWGMSERVGPINFQQSEEHAFLGREVALPTKYSERSAQLVDEEITVLIKRCEKKTDEQLSQHSKELSVLALALLESETLTGDQARKLVGLCS